MEQFEEMYDICPFCGYEVGTPAEDAIHLNPGTMLHDRYIMGRVLGYGGFGVTYIGWDGKLEQKVAIKEYLPSEFSTRMPGQTCVTIFNGDKSEQFAAGLDKFVDEGNRLAKFMNEQGIVKIYDSFQENDTAYIVMEYLEGETLAQRLEREGTIPEDEAVGMLMPIMESLKAVHEEGIIHRDISPDNIFLKSDGTVKLIDFGASRYATTTYSRSLTVIVKPGYSPEEQYRSSGDQGPHTDVYSLAATLYKMITGKRPPDAMDRRKKIESKNVDLLLEPTRINKSISVNRENAILNALNIRIEDRTPDIETFMQEINADPPAKRRAGHIKKIDVLSWPLWLKILIPSLLAVVITMGTLLATGVIKFSSLFNSTLNTPDGYLQMPDLYGTKYDGLEKELSKYEYKNVKAYKGINYTIIESIESEYAETGTVVYQDIPAGSFITKSDKVGLKVNRGTGVLEAVNGVSTVPFVVGSSQEEAIEMLTKAGLKYAVKEAYNDNVDAGLVSEQSIEFGKEVAEGTEITITVSKGPEAFDVPNVVGMDYEEAEALLYNKGLIPVRKDKETSQYPENQVIAQSPSGEKVKNGDSVELTVATSEPAVSVTDVSGMTAAQAKSALEKQGLKVVTANSYSDTVEKGKVISQTPAAGSSAAAGSTVTLIISDGPEEITVPNVKGKTQATAQSTLEGEGFNTTVTTQFDEKVEQGKVISQSPASGTKAKRGDTVNIVVSLGSSKGGENGKETGEQEKAVTVPDVTGKSESAAKSALQGQGLTVKTTEEYNDTVASGNVVSQTPGGGSSARKGDTVTLVISKGKEPVSVSDVVGKSESTAKSALEKQGFTVKTTEEYSDTVASGNVISQEPKSGSTGYKGDTITLVVSKGKEPITIADVVGKTEAEAKSTLEKQKFTVKSSSVYSDTVAQGKVISQSPKAGSTGYKDDTISITVSKGKQPVNVTFNANGGSVETSSKTVYHSDTYGTLPTPSKDGYDFDGWFTSSSGGTPITSSTKVTATSNQTLYAHWSAMEITVTFNANGGSVSQSSKKVTFDSTYSTLPTPTRTGYTFEGWFTDSTGGSQISSSTEVTVTSSSQTLYAHWSAIPIKVTFNANGGSVSQSSATVYYGNTYGSLPIPTRDYYSFNGWFTSSSGGNKVTSSTVVSSTSNHTLFAQWTENSVSGWVLESEVPSGTKIVDTKTQYRYKDKQTTTAASSPGSGWSQNGVNNTNYGNWGSNQTTTTKPTESDTLKIVSQTTTYNYYHYCSKYNNKWNVDSVWVNSSSKRHTYSTTKSLPSYTINADQGGRRTEAYGYQNCTNQHACEYNFYTWWLESTVTTYTYQTRTKTIIYNWYKWTDWSSWSDSAVSSSSTREVQTRKLCRYRAK